MIKRVMTSEGLVVTEVNEDAVEVNSEMKGEIKGLKVKVKSLEKENERLSQSFAETKRLSEFLQTFYPQEIGKGNQSESAVDVVIRMLQPKEAIEESKASLFNEKEKV